MYSSFTFCYFLFFINIGNASGLTGPSPYLLILNNLATIFQEKPVNLPNALVCLMKGYFSKYRDKTHLLKMKFHVLFWTQTVSFVKTVLQMTFELNFIVQVIYVIGGNALY